MLSVSVHTRSVYLNGCIYGRIALHLQRQNVLVENAKAL